MNKFAITLGITMFLIAGLVINQNLGMGTQLSAEVIPSGDTIAQCSGQESICDAMAPGIFQESCRNSLYFPFNIGVCTRAGVSPTTVQQGSVANSISLSGCTTITQSGNYTLANDIHNAPGTCITVRASDVHLDCQGHSIFPDTSNFILPVISIEGVNNFSIASCSITYNEDALRVLIDIKNSSQGLIHKNNFMLGQVNAERSSFLTVSSNLFNKSIYQQRNTTDSSIKQNQFIAPTGDIVLGANIYSTFGARNLIQENTVDGKWDGVVAQNFNDYVGADDGIVISDESDDIVTGNKTNNQWECGIETTGLIQNILISNNSVTNAGLAGICGWHWSSWKENTVSGNNVSHAPRIFNFHHENDLLPGQEYIYFINNRFTNNVLRNPINPAFNEYFDLGRIYGRVTKESYVVGGNIFTNNDFSVEVQPPNFIPPNLAVDGGGNICKTVLSALTPPLRCLSSQSSSSSSSLSSQSSSSSSSSQSSFSNSSARSSSSSSSASSQTSVSNDISVSTNGTAEAMQGSRLQYNITVTNNGSANANNVTFIYYFPSELQPQTTTGAGCTFHNGQLRCAFGQIEAGKNVMITATFLVLANAGTCVQHGINSVVIAATDTSQSNISNDSATITTTITCPY